MTPEDPRHGTTAGHNAGCRCSPCCSAKLAYDKRRRLDVATGKPRTLPAWRVARRLEALKALGWSLRRIAEEAGVKHNDLASYGKGRSRVSVEVFTKIDAAYQRLCMTTPPQRDRWERQGVARAKSDATRRRLAPPLAYDDIDTDERPQGLRSRSDCDYDSQHILDEAAVIRVLAGENLPTNRAEKTEIMRRWIAAGRSQRSLCERMGWRDGRYTTRNQEAS